MTTESTSKLVIGPIYAVYDIHDSTALSNNHLKYYPITTKSNDSMSLTVEETCEELAEKIVRRLNQHG